MNALQVGAPAKRPFLYAAYSLTDNQVFNFQMVAEGITLYVTYFIGASFNSY